MTPSDRERATAFLRSLADGSVEDAAEFLSPDHHAEVAATAPTHGDVDLQPTAALERLRLLLTRQYGAFEEVADVTMADGDDGDETVVDATLAFESDTQSVRLGLNAEGRITALDLQQTYALPAYADAAAFTEREVTVTTGDDADPLDATLTVPTGGGEGPVPGIVLVKGSGRTDRDYTMGPNKLYRDIATGLASRGVAVLRYEERTLVPREDGMLGLKTMVADTLAALERLASVDGVAPDRLFVAGWSFGGIPLPRIAAEHGGLAGLALLDTPPYAVYWEARGDHRRALLEAEWLTDAERDAIEAQAREMDKADQEDFGGAERVQGYTVDVLEEFVAYDHGATLRDLSGPTFVLGTGREIDTTFETAFERWQESLPEATTSFVWCPALNHTFQRGEGPATGLAPGLLHDSVDRRLVDELADWIHDVPAAGE